MIEGLNLDFGGFKRESRRLSSKKKDHNESGGRQILPGSGQSCRAGSPITPIWAWIAPIVIAAISPMVITQITLNEKSVKSKTIGAIGDSGGFILAFRVKSTIAMGGLGKAQDSGGFREVKQYKFRLEQLLFHRETLEEKCQQELADEKSALSELQDKLNGAFDNYRKHRISDDCKTLSPAELDVHSVYKHYLAELLENTRESVNRQRKAVGKVKGRLLKLHRDKRVVEILREKDLKSYQYEVKREETKQLDEFSTMRHGRKRGAEK